MKRSSNTRIKLGAEELRFKTPSPEELEKVKMSRREIYIVCDNVLDTYNIGAIFRLADAVGAKRVYLCGGSETPPNSRIQKASVGTWQWVEWEYNNFALDALDALKTQIPDLKTVAIELDDRAISYDEYDYTLPVALVVGHESDGVSRDVMDKCDTIVQLPMLGVNKSLNVMVSLGIVLYEALEKNKFK